MSKTEGSYEVECECGNRVVSGSAAGPKNTSIKATCSCGRVTTVRFAKDSRYNRFAGWCGKNRKGVLDDRL